MKIYDRILTTDGHLATVKYIGTIPDKIWGAGTLVLGIEWDNAGRGKNDGSIEGIEYFKTENKGSGSFIKANSKKILTSRYTFVDAILQQYSSNVNFDQNIEFNTKVVESFGFEKLNNIQSNFENLVSVSLDKKCIYKSFDEINSFKRITSSLKNVEHLDLSYNLINDLKDINDIVDNLVSLKILNLNGNKFYKKELDIIHKHFQMKSLLLASTNINLKDLTTYVFPKFSNLSEISLASTNLTDSDFEMFNLNNTNITSIDLSFNDLTQIPACFSNSKVTVLNIADNQIKSVIGYFNGIKSLDLRNNKIDTWKFIDSLSTNFSGLSDLRINGNPLFKDMTEDESYFNTIARFNCQESRNSDKSDYLCKFNGSFILEDDINNANLFFISQVNGGKISYDLNSKRWQDLIKMYNIKQLSNSSDKINGRFESKKILLHFRLQNEIFSRTFLRSNTILRVKGILAKRLKKLFIDINLYYYVYGSIENSKMYLDDLNIIDDYGFSSEQTIYIS